MSKIVIDQKNFLAGMSQTDESNDGGFSPEDKGADIYVKKGLLYPQTITIANTGAVYPIIAWAEATANSATNFLGVGVNGSAATFYKLDSNGNQGASPVTQTDGAKSYASNYTDAIRYGGSYYITSADNISKLAVDFSSVDNDWWTAVASGSALSTGVPHFLIDYDQTFYITNGSKLSSWDGSTAVDTAFEIDPEYNIMAGFEFGDKLYLVGEKITTSTTLNTFAPARVFVWNKRSSLTEAESKFEINDVITAVYNFDGILLFFTKKYVGYYNGTTVEPLLYKNTGTFNIKKHQITQIENKLFFADGKDIWCWDKERFTCLFVTTNDATIGDYAISGIYSGYYRNLYISANSKTFYMPIHVGDGKCYWRGLRYNFDQKEIVDRLLVELDSPLLAGTEMEFYFYDHDGTEHTIGTMTYAVDGSITSKLFPYINVRTSSLQPRVYFKADGRPIKQLTYWTRPTENQV